MNELIHNIQMIILRIEILLFEQRLSEVELYQLGTELIEDAVGYAID